MGSNSTTGPIHGAYLGTPGAYPEQLRNSFNRTPLPHKAIISDLGKIVPEKKYLAQAPQFRVEYFLQCGCVRERTAILMNFPILISAIRGVVTHPS
jgi:hypothetical protein